ncbi:stage V sporulation protein D [Haloimpatiens sp. FM7330]
MNRKSFKNKSIMKYRMVFVFLLFFLICIALIGRLAYVMIFKSDEYKTMAIKQWTSIIKIHPKRGKILDRNGDELAVSINVYRVDLDLKTLRKYIEHKKIPSKKVADKLAVILDMDSSNILKTINKTVNGKKISAAMLKRRIDKDTADKIRKLHINGVVISNDTKRYYPNKNFLAHVLGHTNYDGKGLNGVELMYDKYLKGQAGKKIVETDSRKNELPYSTCKYEKPIEGYNVMLTIDDKIQHFIEKAAEKALIEKRAKAVTILVMNPNTGEVLGMVNKPDYDPNNPWEEGVESNELQKLWRNRAVSDTFEPGSIFKVITAATALSEKIVNPETYSVVCNGGKKVGNTYIHCWKTRGHGRENFVDILRNSCNVGFIDVGQKIGVHRLNKYIKIFGFGKKTGIDLNGEAKGIIKSENKVTKLDLASMSFGQVNTVSCIQYLTAFNAVANGGYWIKPHVMEKVVKVQENKEVIKKEFKKEEKRILRNEVTAKLRGYLEKVVSNGVGKNTYIKGYHIGGKTGTAQKVKGRGYGEGKYVSSFVGMAPVDNPKITVMVSVDEPNAENNQYYASYAATPVAKEVFYDIFNYLGWKPDDSNEK